MSSIASQVPPSPLPDRAWNGRSWWFSCCSGCCLGFLLILGIVFLVGGWSAKSGSTFLDLLRERLSPTSTAETGV
ncbi:hypothetical protein M0Q28_02035 [Patescibacteria group bacterium]|nr:hypothetical protein [Patescibacteria group bacterium]